MASSVTEKAGRESARTEERREPQAAAAGDRIAPRRRWRWLWIAPPSWLISAVVHAIAFLALGFLTFALPDDSGDMAILSSTEADLQEEELETVQFEVEPLELETTVAFDTAMPEPGAVDFGDVSLESQLVATEIGVGPVQETTIGEIGALFGSDGTGMSEAGPGEGAAYFFGVKTKGNRFVYAVDNSNSMNRGKFETAVAELQRSIGALNEYQYFYVIFFSDTAYPLFYPQAAPGMVRATDENKRRLEYWLMTVERCLRTKGREAMHMAFAMRPDAIYVLGDGAFTDNTYDVLMAVPPTGTTVHTLGFRMNLRAEQQLRDIARKFNGKFTEVQITPAMVARSRQLGRPLNRTRHGVWGIQLPAGP